jgi:dihydroflavonol-4-reductase
MGSDDLVVVTGASGFIAKHVIKGALARGYRVRGTLRRPESENEVRAAVGESGSRLSFVGADLLSDGGWPEALAGCRYLLHLASPFPLIAPAERYALVPPARDGTLRVLRAAAAAGVEGAVLTSSCVAVWAGHRPDANRVFTEADWTETNVRHTDSYSLSKTLAEKAAWDFIAAEGKGPALATVNPSFVAGPPLDGNVEASAQLILLFLRGAYPFVPNYGFEFVDVRDVAEAHLLAMEKPEAAGKRFIVSGGPLMLREIAEILGREFPDYKKKMPRAVMPDLATRLVALFDRGLRQLVPDLGPPKRVSTERAREVLGLRFRPAEEAAIAMARSLIEMKLV